MSVDLPAASRSVLYGWLDRAGVGLDHFKLIEDMRTLRRWMEAIACD